jgi:hypothetical protein
MRKKHRNIEFDVHRLDDKRWEWVAYPKMGEGVRFSGTVEGDEEKATAAAKVEIDARLGLVAESRKNAPPFQPDPSQWSTSNWDDAARIATSRTHRSAALLDGGVTTRRASCKSDIPDLLRGHSPNAKLA